MQRLSARKKIKLIALLRRRRTQAARRRVPRETRRTRIQTLIEQHSALFPYPTGDQTRLPLLVPSRLSLRDNYDDTVALVNSIRSYALDQFIPVQLFFDQVTEVEPAALMVLTAEIHRCRSLRRHSGRPLVHGTYPNDPAVYAQLRESGFFKLLQIEDINPPEDEASTVVVLPFLTDVEVPPERAEAFIDRLAQIIAGVVLMDEKSNRYLFGAVIEAMKNSYEHAYKLRPPHQMMGRRWWLTGALDIGRREVSILLFDQGIGIPHTLEPSLKARAESLAKLEGLTPPDSLMIEIATRIGQTSTGQSGRGRGFMTMKKFVDACDDGDLFIYSNFGLFAYNRNGSDRLEQGVSLGGTLIQWRFRHSATVTGIEP